MGLAVLGGVVVGCGNRPPPAPLPAVDLARLPNLLSVEILQSQVTDLTPLASLKQLRFLDLSGAPVRDVLALAELSELERCR